MEVSMGKSPTGFSSAMCTGGRLSILHTDYCGIHCGPIMRTVASKIWLFWSHIRLKKQVALLVSELFGSSIPDRYACWALPWSNQTPKTLLLIESSPPCDEPHSNHHAATSITMTFCLQKTIQFPVAMANHWLIIAHSTNPWHGPAADPPQKIPGSDCKLCRNGRYNLCPRMRFIGSAVNRVPGALCRKFNHKAPLVNRNSSEALDISETRTKQQPWRRHKLT
jgi:hypothetical protein